MRVGVASTAPASHSPHQPTFSVAPAAVLHQLPAASATVTAAVTANALAALAACRLIHGINCRTIRPYQQTHQPLLSAATLAATPTTATASASAALAARRLSRRGRWELPVSSVGVVLASQAAISHQPPVASATLTSYIVSPARHISCRYSLRHCRRISRIGHPPLHPYQQSLHQLPTASAAASSATLAAASATLTATAAAKSHQPPAASTALIGRPSSRLTSAARRISHRHSCRISRIGHPPIQPLYQPPISATTVAAPSAALQ